MGGKLRPRVEKGLAQGPKASDSNGDNDDGLFHLIYFILYI